MEIVHISSVHYWGDTRILHKMCRSLADAGHRVHFVVPRSGFAPVETRDGVTIHAVPRSRNRLDRVTGTARRVFRCAARIPADVYHVHDPELLFRAWRLQSRLGRPVVYDVHEDLRLQVYDKAWIPSWGRKLASLAVGRMEDSLAPRLAGVVAATRPIAERFASHPHCVVVQNLPILDELKRADSPPIANRAPRVAYVGVISQARGACQMAKAMALLPPALRARLTMLGDCRPAELEDELRAIAGPELLEIRGWCGRDEVAAVLAEASVGMVMSLPIRCYVDAQSTKLLEYLSVGVPVVVSDLPPARKIIEQVGCGLCVDPYDPQAIADAIRWLLEHPEEAQRMGQRGRAAVENEFNWEREFQGLLELYDRLTSHAAPWRRRPPVSSSPNEQARTTRRVRRGSPDPADCSTEGLPAQGIVPGGARSGDRARTGESPTRPSLPGRRRAA